MKQEEKEKKIQELADTINTIKIPLYFMDLEFAKQTVSEMYDQANFNDSAAVLNPIYNPLKPDIVRKQAQALQHLVEYVETLKEVDEMKKELHGQEEKRGEILKMFL